MKSKFLSVLVAGLFSMALQAEAAVIQWTFSGQVAPVDSMDPNEITNVLGSFTFDTISQSASNFMYTIGGNSMTIQVVSTQGFGSDGVGINYETSGESVFLRAVRIEELSMPGEIGGGLTIPLGSIYYSEHLPAGGLAEGIVFRGEYVNNVNTVPLPASALLFAPAALGLFGLRRKENS